MPLADSGGPRWIRQQHVETEKRRRGLGPVRDWIAALFGVRARPPKGSGEDDPLDVHPIAPADDGR